MGIAHPHPPPAHRVWHHHASPDSSPASHPRQDRSAHGEHVSAPCFICSSFGVARPPRPSRHARSQRPDPLWRAFRPRSPVSPDITNRPTLFLTHLSNPSCPRPRPAGLLDHPTYPLHTPPTIPSDHVSFRGVPASPTLPSIELDDHHITPCPHHSPFSLIPPFTLRRAPGPPRSSGATLRAL